MSLVIRSRRSVAQDAFGRASGETLPSRIDRTEATLPPFLSHPRSAFRKPRKHLCSSVAPAVAFLELSRSSEG